MTRLLPAPDGVVYLNKDRLLVCSRGPEDLSDIRRGYGRRHAVLGALDCGAFRRNPADWVAEAYSPKIAAGREHFYVTAFAIFASGYGAENYAPFAREFGTNP
jgi:hypothetical protein